MCKECHFLVNIGLFCLNRSNGRYTVFQKCMFQRISSLFPFSGWVVCFFVLNVALVSQKKKIHYH